MSITSALSKLLTKMGGTPTSGDNTDELLNKIGDAYSGGSGGGDLFAVNVTFDEETDDPTVDKTFAEIKAAFDQGKVVVLIADSGQYSLTNISNASVDFGSVLRNYADVGSLSGSFISINSDDEISEDLHYTHSPLVLYLTDSNALSVKNTVKDIPLPSYYDFSQYINIAIDSETAVFIVNSSTCYDGSIVILDEATCSKCPAAVKINSDDSATISFITHDSNNLPILSVLTVVDGIEPETGEVVLSPIRDDKHFTFSD